MSKEQVLRRDISWFLATNKTINHINFALRGRYKVYPRAYQSDVSYAIKGEKIQVKIRAMPAGTGAQYNGSWLIGDTIYLPQGFGLANYRDQAFLIHECTHAHIDNQGIGTHSSHEDEAVAYVAEAVYLEALKKPPLGQQRIRHLAHAIAKKVMKGVYWVPDGDSNALIQAIARHPAYARVRTLPSNGVWSTKNWFNPCK